MAIGKFITLEGADGVGKSTHVQLLAEALERCDIPVLVTREPGGTPGAEKIRTLLKDGAVNEWLPLSEVLLLYAGRFDHVEKVIKPALEKGTWVISDRLSDSTIAYQCYAHNLNKEIVERIHHLTLGSFRPDLTLFLDNDVEQTFSRVEKRVEAEDGYVMDRVEQLGESFQARLIQGYREILEDCPHMHEINARLEKQEVHEAICALVKIWFSLNINPVEVPKKGTH